MPQALSNFSIVVYESVFVVGGRIDRDLGKTLYRLSLETFEWTTMAHMENVRWLYGAVLKEKYLYIW